MGKRESFSQYLSKPASRGCLLWGRVHTTVFLMVIAGLEYKRIDNRLDRIEQQLGITQQEQRDE